MKVIKQSRRNTASRLFHAKNDKEKIAAWRLDLNGILQVFNVCPIIHARLFLTARLQTELAVTTHVVVSDIHRNMLKGPEGADNQQQSVSGVQCCSTTG